MSELASVEHAMRGNEFIRYAKLLAASGFDRIRAAESAAFHRAPERVRDAITKAAVGAAGPGASEWGEPLVGYQQMAGAFLDSLRTQSVFFRMLNDGALRRVPLRTRIGFVTANATGSIVAPGQATPISRLTLSNPTLDALKAQAIVVVTNEVLESTVAGAEAAFARMLRQGVSDVVDERFLTEIAPTSISLATASPQTDLRNLLNAVNTSGTGSLYFVMSPRVANVIGTKLATNGTRLFPEMTPTGGQLLGVPALVTRSVPNLGGSPAILRDSLWLIDAAGIAAASETITVDLARETSLQMDTAPTMHGITPTAENVVSLWQANMVGLRASVWFGVEKFQSTAVAALDNVPSAW